MGLLYIKTEDGRKKPSVWVWLVLLGTLLGVSIFLVTNTRETGLDEMAGKTKKAKAQQAPIPVEKGETSKSTAEMDAQTRNEMTAQINRETEENNGYLAKPRRDEIEEKYHQLYAERMKANFRPSTENRLSKMQHPDATPPPAPQVDTSKTTTTRYRTLSERLAAEGIKTGGGDGGGGKGGGKSIDFAPPTNGANKTPIDPLAAADGMKENSTAMKSFLPLGTFIPCVLDGDIVTSTLTSNVWANVVIDVTFRRQLQLPKGLVKLRGKTAMEPTQDVVDIVFDTMVFSDGTELPISGFAYAAFDPRYPHRFRTRGVPGEIIVPPMWIKFQSLILSAALGASDAYIQNYIAENTTTPSTWTSIPVTTTTGNTTTTTTQMVQNQGQAVNGQIAATVGLSAAQQALTQLVTMITADAEKYKPYLIVEKGTPLFVQLDATVDVGTRRLNGFAISKDAEMRKNIELSKQGVPMPDTREIYPPGDARAKYTGQARSGGDQTGNALAGVEASQNQLNNMLKNNLNTTGPGTSTAMGEVDGTYNTTTPQSVQNILKNLQ